MNRAGAILIVCTGFLGLANTMPRPAQAAWPTDPMVNVPVCTAADYQSSPDGVGDGAGGAIIVWEDNRSGFSYDIYAQRITSDGTVLWAAGGVAACTDSSTQVGPVIVSDAAGGAIVAWADRRSGAGYDIYAQRIAADGTALWATDGVAICTAEGDQQRPVIVSDGAGGAIVAWLDYRLGYFDQAVIYTQQVAAGGTPGWTTDGVALCAATANRGYPVIAADGAGGAVVAWCNWPGGVDSDLYVQSVAANGTVQWAADGVPLCTATDSQESPAIVPDGAGGAIVAWHDRRSAFDYDVYAQRITAGGAALWAADGVPVCTAGFDQLDVVMVADDAGGVILAWKDSRNYYADISAQRIAADGSAYWPANGLLICTANGDQGSLAIAADGAGGAVLTWQDGRVGVSSDIYAQRISAGGATAWAYDGNAVCTANGQQGFPCSVALGAGRSIIAWSDNRFGASDIFAQGVDGDGGFFFMPTITSVRDITGDQGGKVRVAWDRSTLDVRPTLEISLYGIWRQVSSSAAQAALAGGAQLVGEDKQSLWPRPGVFRAMTSGTKVLYWEGVGTVAARGEPTYTFVAPTLADSSGVGGALTTFMVDAHLAFRPGFYDSDPAQGYSVDNLSPPPPAAFAGSYFGTATALHWQPSQAPDLAGYRLYRGDTADFTPGPANFVVAQSDTGFVDHVAGVHHYQLYAADIHGNLSAGALLSPGQTSTVTGVPSAALRLHPNFPNPFNPVTTIRFELPSAGSARLAVYDVAGRLVRTLVDGGLTAGSHEAVWDGNDASGRAVGSGLYLARLTCGGSALTVRMGLIR